MGCGGLLSDKIFNVTTFELRQSIAAFTASYVVSVGYGWNQGDSALNGGDPCIRGTERLRRILHSDSDPTGESALM